MGSPLPRRPGPRSAIARTGTFRTRRRSTSLSLPRRTDREAAASDHDHRRTGKLRQWRAATSFDMTTWYT